MEAHPAKAVAHEGISDQRAEDEIGDQYSDDQDDCVEEVDGENQG